MSNLQPLVKWSGSKRSQAKAIVEKIPDGCDTYYESFCGGCSVLFYILNNCPSKFKHYICNDLNKPLIGIYNTVKANPIVIKDIYSKLWNELNKDNDLERKKDFFGEVRDIFNKTQRPELFFFIMRTTTNGMPRYNSAGDFNNSFHITRNGIAPERCFKIIDAWSELLIRYDVQFTNGSYDTIVPTENDFLYLDPPYANTKGMYYGAIDNDHLWDYLRGVPCDWALSFDGVAGEENNIYNVPSDLYDEHCLLKSGNSSFRRVVGNSLDTIVYESLYLKRKGSTK